MERPKFKDYQPIEGERAYDYVSDVNIYMDKLEAEINRLNKEAELTDENREYPTPQKLGFETLYPDGTRLWGSWNSRLMAWQNRNLHRIRKGD